MTSGNGARRPGMDPRNGAEVSATTSIDQDHGNPLSPRADVEVARLRVRLRRMAAAAGRPVRTAADERAHADRRRSGELARMGRVGA
ncbi:hypothetical protein UG55_103535 [Frankia sp. EI5c]|uniref:hypothetical protein n=1 Tax=Frankia sp. EI5c TaxID=683316 RepID=UPI0007C2874E|nr:hypothetical protein [Frankia sp. EI5c]OAA23601.1 hypothetical protein UG55_103535 [Frankia sp. EI5c]